MRKLILILGFCTLPAAASGESADGVWKTEVNDDGGYLLVTIGPCENAEKTCGVISSAFSAQGEDPDYEYLGKQMVWDMKSSGNGSYSGGKIWDPQDGKTYKSKMKLTDEGLDVEGCVAFICSGQDWTRAH